MIAMMAMMMSRMFMEKCPFSDVLHVTTASIA
jgi:hypothetical protein